MSTPSLCNSVKALSAMRIAFGAAWLFDGILKFQLLASGYMQDVITGFGVGAFASHWYHLGLVIAFAETLGGLALLMGVFQRMAAIGSSFLMLLIYGFGGFGGLGTTGQVDLGGDLMLAMAFAVLVFAPDRYGLSARLHLSRWNLWPRLANESPPVPAGEAVRVRREERVIGLRGPRRRSPSSSAGGPATAPLDLRVVGLGSLFAHGGRTSRPTTAGAALLAAVLLVGVGLVVIPHGASGTSSGGNFAGVNTFVQVRASDWKFDATYTNGTTSSDVIWVPANGVVELNVTSADDHHTFSIPRLGVSVDAMAGSTNHYVLTLPSGTVPGTTYLFECDFPCGSGHGSMKGWLVVTAPT